MAKRHGLETAALLLALNACSSGSKVEPPAVPQISTSLFEDIRSEIESLDELPGSCTVSESGALTCNKQKEQSAWKFTAVPKGKKLLAVNGVTQNIAWDLKVDGSCTSDVASVALTGDEPLPEGGERFLGHFVTTIHEGLPCAIPRDTQAEYSAAYELHLKELKNVSDPYKQDMKKQAEKCLDEGEKILGKFAEKGTPEVTDTVCRTSYGPVELTYTVGIGEEGEKDRLWELDFKDSEYRPHIRISHEGWAFSIRLETGAAASIVSKDLKDLSPDEQALISFLNTLSLAPAPATEYLWLADIHPLSEAPAAEKELAVKVHTYQANELEKWLKTHPDQNLGVVLEGLPKGWFITGADWSTTLGLKEQYPHLTPLAQSYGVRLQFTGTDSEPETMAALEQAETLLTLQPKPCLTAEQSTEYKQNLDGVVSRWTTAAQREVTAAIQFSSERELGGVAIISGLYHGPEIKKNLSGVKVHLAPGLPDMSARPLPVTPPLCQAVAETQ